MNDNVVIAIIAASAVVISAIVAFGVAIVSLIVNNKRLDNIEATLLLIQADLKEWFKQLDRIKAVGFFSEQA